ncbi:MAG: hypothetical protein V1738_03335 [Patescibacteria group bacterium]
MEELLRRSQASMRWKMVFEFFIVFNNTHVQHLLPGGCDYTFNPPNGLPRTINIEIQKDTKLEELRDYWPVIEKAQLALSAPFAQPEPCDPAKIKDDDQSIFGICESVGLFRVKPKKTKKASKSPKKQIYKQIMTLRREGKKSGEIAEEVYKSKNQYAKVNTDINSYNKKLKDNILY